MDCHSRGELDKAVAQFMQAARLDGTRADILLHLGTALQDAGDLDDAASCYRRVLALDADTPREPPRSQSSSTAQLSSDGFDRRRRKKDDSMRDDLESMVPVRGARRSGPRTGLPPFGLPTGAPASTSDPIATQKGTVPCTVTVAAPSGG